MNSWENFFTAEAGASAALAGLIFVSVSISLAKILATPQLPERAFQALVVLVQILIISSCMLVPGQSYTLIGLEVLAIALAVWPMVAIYDRRTLARTRKYSFPRAIIRTLLSQLAALAYIVAGVAILWLGAPGIYCLVPAILFAFAIAIFDAWVLLVEINR
jgi:modulator of FtsH protease